MTKHEAKYHALLLLVDYSRKFLKQTRERHSHLDPGTKKILKELNILQFKLQKRADVLIHHYTDYQIDCAIKTRKK